MTTWLSVSAALLVYLLTVLGLTPALLHGTESLTYEQFEQSYPAHRWLLWIHEWLAIPVFLISLIGGRFLARAISAEIDPFAYGAWLTISAWNLYNGVYELLTGMCPTYGMLIKRYSRQDFVLDERVKLLGVIRIVLSGVVVVGVWTAARH